MEGQQKSTLLAVDSIINVILGACLLVAPGATINFFGLPQTDTHFYVTVLGAILLGIGIALWIERRNQDGWNGLGLIGAIVINVLGAGTVLIWLIIDPFDLPLKGYIVLWCLTLLVAATGFLEFLAMTRNQSEK